MITLRRNDLFAVEINHGLLIARRSHQTLFSCALKPLPWLVVHSGGLYAHNAHDTQALLYRGDDAAQLLDCLTTALTGQKRVHSGRRRLAAVVAPIALAITVWFSLLPPAALKDIHGTATVAREESLAGAFDKGQHVVDTAQLSGGNTPAVPALPRSAQQVSSNPLSATPSPDNWPLSGAVRAGLPVKLGNAAARGLFTVSLSTGHARTLYVFADPECANCRRMERQFEMASGLVNVVIFPVTTVGGTDSLHKISPVLCLPDIARAGAWKQLFAADAGMAVPGNTAGPAAGAADAAKCETATAAVGVNEVAYRAYRLPGTPWTISDDGRYVPQAMLSSPVALQSFLNEGVTHDGR